MPTIVSKNRQRVYRVLVGIETKERLNLFNGTPENSARLLRQMMAEGTVDIVYRKKSNGELVRRTGTLDINTIPYQFRSDADRNNDPDAITLNYWDLLRGGWRSCAIENLVGYFE